MNVPNFTPAHHKAEREVSVIIRSDVGAYSVMLPLRLPIEALIEAVRETQPTATWFNLEIKL